MEPYFDPDKTKKCSECGGHDFELIKGTIVECQNCGKKVRMPSREIKA